MPEELLENFHVDCLWYDAPLDWTAKGNTTCGRTTPVYLQRIYSRNGMNPQTAKGHFVVANPGGPGGNQLFYQSNTAFIEGFHNLTDHNHVMYFQKVRGVANEGGITCANGQMLTAVHINEYSDEEKKCIHDVFKAHGTDFKFYGSVQKSHDIHASLKILRKHLPSDAHISAYGSSGGTRLFNVYLNTFPHKEDQFDGFIYDGILSPGYFAATRTYSEGMATITKMTMTECLYRSECWEHFKGLTYDHLPVRSIHKLYEQLISTMKEKKENSKCFTRIKEAVGETCPDINADNVVLSLQASLAAFTQSTDARPLVPAMVRKMYSCELDGDEDAASAVQSIAYAVAHVSMPQLYNRKLYGPPIFINDFLYVSELVNEFMERSDLENDVLSVTKENFLDPFLYHHGDSFADIMMAKEVIQNNLFYNFNQSLSGPPSTERSVLALNGDMDPQTPLVFSRNYFGSWMKGAGSHQYSFVVPMSAHPTSVQSRTAFNEQYTCGLQMITAFVKNRGEMKGNDAECTEHPIKTDFKGEEAYTQGMTEQFFNSKQLW